MIWDFNCCAGLITSDRDHRSWPRERKHLRCCRFPRCREERTMLEAVVVRLEHCWSWWRSTIGVSMSLRSPVHGNAGEGLRSSYFLRGTMRSKIAVALQLHLHGKHTLFTECMFIWDVLEVLMRIAEGLAELPHCQGHPRMYISDSCSRLSAKIVLQSWEVTPELVPSASQSIPAGIPWSIIISTPWQITSTSCDFLPWWSKQNPTLND